MLVHIQILRFAAAVAVVAFHTWGIAPAYMNVPKDAWSFGFEHGGHGVDLFFVLSGFIIFHATHRALSAGKLAPREFLRRRVERVVPCYFLVIAVVTTMAWTWPAIFGADDWYSLRHVLKSLGFISFTDGEMPVVYLGWSLEYEMFFYLAAASLMAITANVWRNVVVLFSALVGVGQLPGVNAALGHYSFFVDPLLLEFALGVVAAKLFADKRLEWPVVAAPALALAALLVNEPSNRAILFGLPSVLLVYLAARISQWRAAAPSRSERVLERLGDASYAIYLAQVQTISFACMGLAAIAPGMPPQLMVLIVTAIVVAFGFSVNVLVERPLLTLCRRIGMRNEQRKVSTADGALPRAVPATS